MDDSVMKGKIETFFKVYENQFKNALDGKLDLEMMGSCYSEEFIAENTYGVKT